MDLITLLEIVIAFAVIYFLLRFIVSPIINAVMVVIIAIVFLYVLQNYFGFNFGQILAPFGISFNSSSWGSSFNWLLGPLGSYIDQIKSLVHSAWGNLPKTK